VDLSGRTVIILLALVTWLTLAPAAAAGAAAPVTVVVDGRTLTLQPAPFIAEDRVLVPLRGVFETLGAAVDWDGATRTVTARRPGSYVRLRIDSRVACLAPGCDQAAVLDVPAFIRDGRTFVPLRFVATALGAEVTWDGARRAVVIRDGATAPPTPTLRVTTVSPWQRVRGPFGLRSELLVPGASSIRYFLLDPATGRGPVVALGSDPGAAYPWRPDPTLNGLRLLAAVAYSAAGRVVASDVVPVVVEVDTAVVLGGVAPGQRVEGPVSLRAVHGFPAAYARYSLLDPVAGGEVVLGEGDPEAEFTWTPLWTDNGPRRLVATVFDRLGRAHRSAPVAVTVQVGRRTAVGGVQAGARLTGPVTLRAVTNYPVTRVQFLLDGAVLAERTDGSQSHYWFPGPQHNGARRVSVRVWDAEGNVFESATVGFQVAVEPTLRLLGVGPNQVLSGPVDLRVEANVPLSAVEITLVDPSTGTSVAVMGRGGATSYRWTPSSGQDGQWQVRAVATDTAGLRLAAGPVPVRVYTGPLYGPVAIVPRDEFIPFTSRFALADYQRTGISAALQVAQAILETGWGQSVPVDKYSGQPSLNLFGIKGQGPAGSVISNTWEEANGVAYRIDAAFRAYHAVEQSWQDHKALLLGAGRYAPFREVMHDPVLGAWALRRSGYATDSRYAIKLVDIMRRYNLFALDDTEP